jgi:MarR family transcriptional regulator, organic hydroperoxide resistance regulator
VEQAQRTAWDDAQPERVLPLLRLISDLVEKRCDKFLSQRFNLTTPQYQLLLAAMFEADTTLGGLSDHLNCSRGNVTGIVDRLERDGWLVRERSSEDRRVITVRLTDKGHKVQEVRAALTGELTGLAGVWDDKERQALTVILYRLYKELREN